MKKKEETTTREGERESRNSTKKANSTYHKDTKKKTGTPRDKTIRDRQRQKGGNPQLTATEKRVLKKEEKTTKKRKKRRQSRKKKGGLTEGKRLFLPWEDRAATEKEVRAKRQANEKKLYIVCRGGVTGVIYNYEVAGKEDTSRFEKEERRLRGKERPQEGQ